jgi:hypothetical protein
MVEAANTSEMSVNLYLTALRSNPVDTHLENLSIACPEFSSPVFKNRK